MNFEPTEEQRLLAESLALYFAKRYGPAERERLANAALGVERAHWIALNDMGVTKALFPPSRGGLGGSAFDVGTVFQGLGGALVVEPFLGALMAGTAMAEAVTDALLSAPLSSPSRIRKRRPTTIPMPSAPRPSTTEPAGGLPAIRPWCARSRPRRRSW